MQTTIVHVLSHKNMIFVAVDISDTKKRPPLKFQLNLPIIFCQKRVGMRDHSSAKLDITSRNIIHYFILARILMKSTIACIDNLKRGEKVVAFVKEKVEIGRVLR